MISGNTNAGYECPYCGMWISWYGNHYCNNNYSWRTIQTPIQPYHTEHCYCRTVDQNGGTATGTNSEKYNDHLACCMCGVRRKK